MGLLRTIRVTFMRRTSLKITVLVATLLVCFAVYAYVALQRDESNPLPSHYYPLLEQQGILRFHARLPGQKTGDTLLENVRAASTENGTVLDNPLRVPRVAEYCNIPTDQDLGEEGDVPEGYTLLSAYVLIRHGDRTPMNTFLGLPRPQPREGCTMDRDALKRSPALRRFMYDMAVNKDKQSANSVFEKWALYPQYRECTSSQLTGRGALQHLHNGLALKDKYVNKWNLFGDKFSPETQLKLWSTQFSRTYQSAVAFLYAFLPHFDITKLDIKASADTAFCNSKFVPQTCCGAQGRLKSAVERPPNNRGRKNPRFNEILAPLAEVFETKVGRLPYAAAIVDTLQGHVCHGVHLPCGTNGKCVTSDMLANLWLLIDSDGKSLAADSNYDTYSRIAMRSLLKEITTDMGLVTKNFTDVKFSLYSGHDITVSPLLQALGLYDGKWPKYATRLVFELYKQNVREKDNFVRILYNGKDVTSLCKLCHHALNSDGLCRLDDFVDALDKDVNEIIGKHNLQSYCQSV